MEYVEVELSQGNINQGHFYIPRESDLFPSDAFGGKNKSQMANTLEIIFTGTDEIVQTDIDGDDTVENAIALCPTCHRELHFGYHA